MGDLPDRIMAHYERHALAWDFDRQQAEWNDRPWIDRFAAGLSRGAAVLDLGCGSGFPIAAHLSQAGLKITGVDSSPTLISLCRQRLPAHEWILGDMRRIALGRAFDAILAWDSYFHLEPNAQRAMFSVFAAHAAPEARLMFNTGPRFGEAIGDYCGDPLYHASLDASEYRKLLFESGFEIIDHAVEDWQSGGGRTIWLARRAVEIQPLRP